MESWQDFTGKDMIEQIGILEDIRQGRDIASLPALLHLYAEPLCDKAVDEMIYYTIARLLDADTELILGALSQTSPRIKMLAVRKVHEKPFPEAREVLAGMLQSEKDSQLLGEILRALGKYGDEALVDELLPFLEHDDYVVVGWTIEALVCHASPRVGAALLDLAVRHVDEVSDAMDCDLRLAMLIENLGKFPDDAVIAFLVDHIHHPNPTLRRLILSSLACMGEAVLPSLEQCLESGDKDEKIMAANVLGLLGLRQGADILVAALEANECESNLRFAIYEALGRIPSLRSVIGLSDGLDEEDELALLAVTDGLEKLINPGVVKVLKEKMVAGGEKASRLSEAILDARAVKLFLSLLQDEEACRPVIEALQRSKDVEVRSVFCKALTDKDDERAAALRELLSCPISAVHEKRIVAADDSNAMLFFYKAVAADLGVALTVAMDGSEALDYFRTDPEVDLLVTDMNMPNMTGIELAREVRKMEAYKKLPILMATTESEAAQKQVAEQAGVNDFISKPFSKETFRLKLTQMLGTDGD